ncbi:MAG: ATP-binding cassette domain-containing protein [Lentisphaerae bacterium]|nr:ATP-binding cassette domain-containing protein [Lentisphaerota bacterium]
MSLLEIKNLTVTFRRGKKTTFNAVDGVSLSVGKGETVGLVGESGCGKSTLGLTSIALEKPTSGNVFFDGRDISQLNGKELKLFRRRVQMVFQDPFGSLNGRLSVGAALDEVLKVHGIGTKNERAELIADTLTDVGLDPLYSSRYPHEFSGGQRQRIGIARALILGPELIIADEPVSALDVSVQVQILNLLKDLQEERGLSYLFIAHDLAVVRYMCTNVYVMYMGEIVEKCNSGRMFTDPAHPYTEALLSAVPDVRKGIALRKGETGEQRIVLSGEASPDKNITACSFEPRCKYAGKICRVSKPQFKEVAEGHSSACHFAGEFN